MDFWQLLFFLLCVGTVFAIVRKRQITHYGDNNHSQIMLAMVASEVKYHVFLFTPVPET